MAPSEAAPPCRVVIVEDHHDTASTLEHLFRLHSLDVRVAHDGAAALDAIREHRPHIVFSDLQLPDMEGFDLAALVRQQFGHKLLLIAVSGLDDPQVVAAAHGAGFDAHFAKPANPFTLLALARNAAAEHERDRRRAEAS